MKPSEAIAKMHEERVARIEGATGVKMDTDTRQDSFELALLDYLDGEKERVNRILHRMVAVLGICEKVSIHAFQELHDMIDETLSEPSEKQP